MVSESILAQRPNIRASNMVADAYFLFLQREQCDSVPKNHLESPIPNNPLSTPTPVPSKKLKTFLSSLLPCNGVKKCCFGGMVGACVSLGVC